MSENDHNCNVCRLIRYRGQRQLRQTSRRFQKVFEQSNDAIIILDPIHETIYIANSRACEMLGYERDELLGISPLDIHPNEVERFREFVSSVHEEGAGRTDDLTCLTKHGEKLRAEISASKIELDDSPYILAIIWDVTTRKEREEELELFRNLLDHSTDSIYVIEPQSGGFIDVNATGCSRLGYSREELLSMSV